jgi:hypothetical protein
MESGDNGLSKTMKMMNEYVSNPDSKFDFITIAGDNFYPVTVKEGGKKMKVFNQANFISGFDCLPKGIKKYVLYGNHDMLDEFEEPAIKCKTLDTQKTLYEEDTKEYEFYDNVISTINSGPITHTLIIMIDTTIYDMEDSTLISDTCYKKLKISESIPMGTIRDLINVQEREIVRIIASTNPSIMNIIIIGHHPIVAGRVKNKEKKNPDGEPIIERKNEIIYLESFINSLNRMKLSFVGKKLYYLCADTHYYQKSIIKINDLVINQYIVGTGGASKDELPLLPPLSVNTITLPDIIVEYVYSNQRMTNGFLIVSINDAGELSTVFCDANAVIDADKEYMQKYLKYKNKYLQLKNTFLL